MSIYIDADAFVLWEKGEFDLPAWLMTRADQRVMFPAAVWQQLSFEVFDWARNRAQKRAAFLNTIGAVAEVAEFSRPHAERAAELAPALKRQQIGFADFQIAASALEDDAELLTFNHAHFGRLPGLKLAQI
jgi:predicted nucleic acid-binding protein